MANETKTPTPAIHALLRSQHHLPADEIREINNIVPDFAARYVNDYLQDRAASRTRKNLLTVGIFFLCLALSVSLIGSVILGQPAGQAITGLTALLNAIGGAFLYFTNRT